MSAAPAAEAASAFLTDGAVMLGAALLFVTIFRKLGLGATLGYIIGGAMIGPGVLDLIRDPQSVMSVSEIGIALLLFLVGMELQPRRLWRLRHDIFGLGLAQVILCGLALSALIYFGLGISLAASVAIGLPLALSSTAQVLPMLRASGELNNKYGESAFSILLFQDLSIVPMITIVAAMSRAPIDPSAPPGWILAVYTVGAVVGLVLVGRFLINPLFRLIGRLGERELFVVAGLFAVIASASLMHSLHLSVPLGAFVAGVMLAESPYRHELESDVEPFRSILLGMFFLSVGMLLDLGVVARSPWLIVGLAAAMITIKTAVIFVLARMFGLKSGRALSLGLLLSQAGEFGFVLFGQAAAAQLIMPEAASLFAAVVTLSMASTPFLMRLIDWLQARMPDEMVDLDGPALSPETNAIVVGYGRFGQTVSQMLMAKGISVTLIDSKPSQIELAEEFGTKVYYGDGTRIDLLRIAGAAEAEAILFCNDGEAINRQSLETILEAFPQAAIMVRAFDRRQLIDLRGLDIAFAQRELFESAVAMGRKALLKLGIAKREVDRVESEYRERDCERLELQGATGDLHALEESVFRPGHELADAPVEPSA
jgi:monovalent cation:proton antiporter-2 (CPA2) family protein